MNYEFSLNKAALISLVAGSIVFALLLFGAGLVVGGQWLTGDPESSESVAQNGDTDQPKEPVLNEEGEAAPKKQAPPKNKDQKSAQPEEEAAGTAAEESAPASQGQPGAKPADGEVKIIQEADPASDQGAQGEPDIVTVQVGVFLDQEEANRLLKDIEKRGYAPSFFSGRDAEARQWFAVRIGAYSDKQQAANAAANFTKQEKLKAVVRPAGSL